MSRQLGARERFLKVFPNGRAFIPVIHVQNQGQATENARIAFGEGADAVAIIDHGGRPPCVLRGIYEVIRLLEKPVILNFLNIGTSRAFKEVPPDAAGLWADDGGIQENAAQPDLRASRFAKARIEANFHGLYFGGVAFKYQEPVKNPEKAARFAKPHIDVITTSGERTGSPPSLTHLRAMRRGIGCHPLANASGLSLEIENLEDYVRLLDAAFVASSITRREGTLEFLVPEKVRAFAKKFHS